MYIPALPTIALSNLLTTEVFAAPTAPSTVIQSSQLPTCNPNYAYSHINHTLGLATRHEIGIISDQAQMTSASPYIIGYPGYGSLIPSIVGPVTNSLNNHWIPALQSAQIKCAACQGPNGTEEHAHVRNFPVLPYNILFDIFDVTSNMLTALEENQCFVPGYTPDASVQEAMGPLIKALFAAIGTGPTIAKAAGLSGYVPAGAILPYYECLADNANETAINNFQDQWFPLIEALLKISQSGCVAQ